MTLPRRRGYPILSGARRCGRTGRKRSRRTRSPSRTADRSPPSRLRVEGSMVYPNFLVVGAQKAGTTWLYRSLRTHPQVWMPREKELHYFDEKIRLDGGLFSRLRGDRPADWRWRRQVKSRLKRSRKDLKWRDVAWDLKYFLREPNDRWYASLFDPGDDQIAGETTPDYSILGKRTISHVRDIMPEAKIILMMRNPVERP